jgi:hypothetical protein
MIAYILYDALTVKAGPDRGTSGRGGSQEEGRVELDRSASASLSASKFLPRTVE